MIQLILLALVAISSPREIHFEKKKISVGTVALTAEMAITPEQRSRGLMFRQSLKDGEGMLFVFEKEQPLGFWMKNTFIPLSIGFFDKARKLVDIQDMKPVESEMTMTPPSHDSAFDAKYALEVPQGWFKKNKIKTGAILNY